jgi:predicted nuclease of restriction endonuclease-like (RecB) superfamily
MRPKRRSASLGLARRPPGYAEWLTELKSRIHAAQQRAALVVNRELLQLYWQIGRDILERQAQEGWGAGIVDQVAADLRAAFPDVRGFSRTNLLYMRAFAAAWPEQAIVQQAVGQLPWGHNLVLLTKLRGTQARLAHAEQAVARGWSRAMLGLHIEQRTLEREGKAVTNFEQRLPKPQSDLARESLKDPYRFDFLTLGSEATELEIESALVTHMTRFLLELGSGFAFVGRLKAGDFKPEHAGQIGFYLTAVDTQVKAAGDGPTIGLLLCKAKNRVVAEYALRDTNKPIGVAEYRLVEALPKDLAQSLPSIEQIERELEAPIATLEKSPR